MSLGLVLSGLVLPLVCFFGWVGVLFVMLGLACGRLHERWLFAWLMVVVSLMVADFVLTFPVRCFG